MTHFAQHAAVRGSNAFHRPYGAVGVKGHIRGHIAVRVHILGSDLAVLRQPAQGGLICYEPALTVRDGHGKHVACLGACQPRGLGAGDPGVSHLADMAANGIKGQGGVVLLNVHNLAVGHQTQLDQRLEPVADTQH